MIFVCFVGYDLSVDSFQVCKELFSFAVFLFERWKS